MAVIDIECPSCGWEGKIDETLVGRNLKCSKCGASFLAEVGGTYDLADAPPSPEGAVSPRRPPAAGPPRPSSSKSSPEEAPEEEVGKSWLEAWPSE